MNKYFEKAVENTKELVKIKSVKEPSILNKPFGEGIYNALNYFLKLAESLGFKTFNYDNYIGEVVFGDGKDEDGLAILCHLDVVPEGDLNKWTYPPYSATEADGKIYGRGIVDDKAPAVLCLYALKELKDSGFIPSRKIKLILGCDEESGWECINHYKKVAIMPNEGFSPDGDFPVIYAEKGILHVEFNFDYDNRILSLSGGERINMVCDYASCKIDNLKESEIKILKGVGLIVQDGEVKSYGKSAHGSTPNKGDNAIYRLFVGLARIGLIDFEVYGNLFITLDRFKDVEDETGRLTFSPDVCFIENNKLKVQTDIRYPSIYPRSTILEMIEDIGEFKILHHQAPIIVDKNGKLVQTLLSIYNKEFSKNDTPIAIGGGTYARALKNGVAFGPSIIGEGLCHEPNEHMKISDMEKCYKIYLKAIKSLAE